MWSDVDDAPMGLVKEDISIHEEPEPDRLDPSERKRINRHVCDHYDHIKTKIPDEFENGKPSDMKYSKIVSDIGETAFRKIPDFQSLQKEIVTQNDSVTQLVFFNYIGARVLENGSGDLFDKIY